MRYESEYKEENGSVLVITKLLKYECAGPHHLWFNIVEDNIHFFKRGGALLVLAGRFVDNCDSLIAGCDTVVTFEKVKSIQQR